MRQTDARSLMDSGLHGVELAVALALWSFADDSGRCWPALRSLCRRSGWRERAVQRALRSLQACGVLSVHHVPVRVTPTYVLHVAALPACAEPVADLEPEADGGCLLDTPGVSHAPPVSVVHPPVSVVHPNPPENPPENPPQNPPEKILSATPTQERLKPERVKRAAEAAQLLALLDGLRLMRHRGRKLSESTWVPKLEKALAKRSAQSIIDGYVWMLRSPQAAFLRGEDGRGTTDYTVDFSTCLAHPEYADRRRWKGNEGPLQPELDRWEAAVAAGEPEPEWVARWAAVDQFAADRARSRMQPMEDGDYDEIF